MKIKIEFDLKIKIEFGLGLMAIEFGFEYRFANCKSSTLIEFEIYNNFENCLAVGANTRIFFFLNNFLINLFKGNLGNL